MRNTRMTQRNQRVPWTHLMGRIQKVPNPKRVKEAFCPISGGIRAGRKVKRKKKR